jgi:Tfp pilus assembly protein PilX
VPTWVIVALVILAILALLAVGGAIAGARRHGNIEAAIDEANRALAAAHAADKGWEPGALRDAARGAFESANPGVTVRDQALVQVVDRPGTDEDQAVFRFITDDGESRLTMGREDGRWVADQEAKPAD